MVPAASLPPSFISVLTSPSFIFLLTSYHFVLFQLKPLGPASSKPACCHPRAFALAVPLAWTALPQITMSFPLSNMHSYKYSSSPIADCKLLQGRRTHSCNTYSWCAIKSAGVSGLQTSQAWSFCPTFAHVLSLDYQSPLYSASNQKNSSSSQITSLL